MNKMTPPKSPPEVVDVESIISDLHEEINLKNMGGNGPYVKAGDIAQTISHLRARYPNGIVWGDKA